MPNSVNLQLSPQPISVVVPTYNSAQWIRETLDSVLAQSLSVLEILVIDDGSTDDTAKIVGSYGPPVSYVYVVHAGVSAARNLGIRMAEGNYVAFVDADDYWDSSKIEAQMRLLVSHGLAWASCLTRPFDDQTGKKISGPVPLMPDGDILEALLLNNFIGSATPLIRKSVFDQVGCFDESYGARIGEDWDMWLRIASHYPLGVVQTELAFQRLHPESTMSRASMRERTYCLCGVVERAVTRDWQRLGPLRNRALANIYYRAGVQLMKRNEYREAQVYFLRELGYFPPRMESLVYLFLSLLGPNLSGPLIAVKRFCWKCVTDLRKDDRC